MSEIRDEEAEVLESQHSRIQSSSLNEDTATSEMDRQNKEDSSSSFSDAEQPPKKKIRSDRE